MNKKEQIEELLINQKKICQQAIGGQSTSSKNARKRILQSKSVNIPDYLTKENPVKKAAPVVKEVEVIKEVKVEVEVIKEVEVILETIVEKVVIEKVTNLHVTVLAVVISALLSFVAGATLFG